MSIDWIVDYQWRRAETVLEKAQKKRSKSMIIYQLRAERGSLGVNMAHARVNSP
jgi:hypothetical protein